MTLLNLLQLRLGMGIARTAMERALRGVVTPKAGKSSPSGCVGLRRAIAQARDVLTVR